MILTDKNNKFKSVIEYGDYQTPVSFAKAVCQKLAAFYDLSVDVVLEPTFGIGNFFNGIFLSFPKVRTLYGIEINNSYYETALRRIETDKIKPAQTNIQLFNADVFTFDLSSIKKRISVKDSVLIIGNPPWVTNSRLASLDSLNLPIKSNFKGYSGLDAITGKGNFDIAEYIIIRLLSEFADYDCTLAMLCKTTVAKNIIRDINNYGFPIASMDLFIFDTNEIFEVSCDAGLLVIRSGTPEARICSVHDFYTNKNIREFGWIQNKFYADIKYYNSHDNIEGKCQFEWRQGIKHDCSKVMELEIIEGGIFKNGIGETWRFRLGQYVFPLIKSSDLKSYEISAARKYVIVPQHRVNEDTSQIQYIEPAIWDYLQKHESHLSARRSVIYKKSPKYSIFGIGDYSFSKYKVCISGFYKEPVFSLVWGEIPIMLDDTCYFLGFCKLSDAVITLSLLNSPECLKFLKSIAFLDSKRPYTKEILQRIDLKKLSNLVNLDYLIGFSESLAADYILTKSDFEDYCDALSPQQLSMFPNYG